MFFETSAKDAFNVENAFNELAQRAMVVQDEREGVAEQNQYKDSHEEVKNKRRGSIIEL